MNNLKELNPILKNLNEFRSKNRNKRIEINRVKTIEEEGEQGMEGLTFEIYPFQDDVFIKLRITTDSYGYNENVTGIEFVTKTEKTITTYE